MDVFFVFFSTCAFVSGLIWLVASSVALTRLMTRVLPLLGETKDHVQDLGDLAANTVGRASDTMDLVELRVSQTMGQAAQGGVSATKQALSVGSTLAGLYMASRIFGMLREQFADGGKRKRNADVNAAPKHFIICSDLYSGSEPYPQGTRGYRTSYFVTFCDVHSKSQAAQRLKRRGRGKRESVCHKTLASEFADSKPMIFDNEFAQAAIRKINTVRWWQREAKEPRTGNRIE